MRLELTTSSLPRRCSTTELPGPKPFLWGVCTTWSGRPDSNRRRSAWKADALPTELLPRKDQSRYKCPYGANRDKKPFPEWRVVDSNHRRHKPADLQSAPFGHSGNPPEFAIAADRCNEARSERKPELAKGLEPATPCLQSRCSTN